VQLPPTDSRSGFFTIRTWCFVRLHFEGFAKSEAIASLILIEWRSLTWQAKGDLTQVNDAVTFSKRQLTVPIERR
jgi:hypothetical protein